MQIVMEVTDLEGRNIKRVRAKGEGFTFYQGTSGGRGSIRSGGAGYITAAVTGDLKAYAKQEQKLAGQAVREAVRRSARKLRTEMKRQMRKAGIKDFKDGDREWWIARLVNSKRGDGIDSIGRVYSGFGRAVRGFEFGGTIRAAGGAKWLMLPTEYSKLVATKTKQRGGGWRLRTDLKLAFVQTKNPRVAMILWRHPGRGDVVAFWLFKEIRLQKRISFFDAAERIGNELPELIVHEWTKRATRKGIEV